VKLALDVFFFPSNRVGSFLEYFLCHKVCFGFSWCSVLKNFSMPHRQLCAKPYSQLEGEGALACEELLFKLL